MSAARLLGRVLVLGRGRLGRTLTEALRSRGASVQSVGWRTGRLGAAAGADLVLLATRDQDIEAAAKRVARKLTPRVLLHFAGSRGPEVLADARDAGISVGQLHPLVAIASGRKPPALEGAWAHVRGDRPAQTTARRLARLLGMRPFTLPGLDLALYHASAVLVAGGAACLLDAASRLLQRAGAPSRSCVGLLAPLLRSVADNAEALGLPDALTGPARRGDRGAIERHAALVQRVAPELAALNTELLLGQLRMAAEADPQQGAQWAALSRALTGAEPGAPGPHTGQNPRKRRRKS